ncbi:lipoprotein peptidase [Mycobacteroides abscessus subsp. abscessus]|nr:lipoprotein peptidase [Mycobacteroides abscessus subsp. abscessus]SLH66438.1 lipoprotein peptidase [Mycobacteroides abscessus subsp. abscessus]
MSRTVSRPHGLGSDTVVPSVVSGMGSTRRTWATVTATALAVLVLSGCGTTTTTETAISSTASLTTPKAPVPTLTRTTEPAPTETIKELVERTIRDADRFWEQELGRDIGVRVEPFDSSRGDRPTCDGNTTNVASYCSATTKEDTILWDVPELERIRSEGGDLAVAAVMSHEYGHAVLDDMGQNPIGNTAERRAWCATGAYLGANSTDYTGDWNTAINAAKPEGAEAPAQRAARIAGINAGRAMSNPAACLSYSP